MHSSRSLAIRPSVPPFPFRPSSLHCFLLVPVSRAVRLAFVPTHSFLPFIGHCRCALGNNSCSNRMLDTGDWLKWHESQMAHSRSNAPDIPEQAIRMHKQCRAGERDTSHTMGISSKIVEISEKRPPTLRAVGMLARPIQCAAVLQFRPLCIHSSGHTKAINAQILSKQRGISNLAIDSVQRSQYERWPKYT